MATVGKLTSKTILFDHPRQEWLSLRSEEIIDPNRPIVDPHHHLWSHRASRYLIEEICADIASGHNVVGTVYVECSSMYRASGPEEYRPVGEVEFANGIAAKSASGNYGPALICAGIVGHVNLLLGERAVSVLEAEIAAGNGRFQGIRHSTNWDDDLNVPGIYVNRSKGLLLDPAFRTGFAQLAPLDLSFDAWLFHPQIGELADLARAFPNTKIVLDHCGGPIGVGSYAALSAETFAVWKAAIQDLSKCSNVVVKLGSLAMRLFGSNFHQQPKPPCSEQLGAAWRPFIETCIDAFGPDRCMFESNFPPDNDQCSYQVLFNAFKRIAAQYSDDETNALFAGTAASFYKLHLPERRT